MPPDTETSYQRALRIADARNAEQWRAYRQRDPLPKAAFVDFELMLAPIVRVVEEQRFTKYVRVYEQDKIERPTERAAFAKARGDDRRDRMLVVRQQPRHEMRYCYGCQTRHGIGEFDSDKRAPSGLAFYCRRAKAEARERVYKRAG